MKILKILEGVFTFLLLAFLGLSWVKGKFSLREVMGLRLDLLRRVLGVIFTLVIARVAASDAVLVTHSGGVVQVEGFTIRVPEFRDFDFRRFPHYGSLGDRSMERDANSLTLVERVANQKADYNLSRAAYKKSWSAKAAQACSESAFTSRDAAWPWNNLALHLMKTNGDLVLALRYLRVAKAIAGTSCRDKRGDVVARNTKACLGLLKARAGKKGGG